MRNDDEEDEVDGDVEEENIYAMTIPPACGLIEVRGGCKDGGVMVALDMVGKDESVYMYVLTPKAARVLAKQLLILTREYGTAEM
jgi:hypothetical protein